MDVRLTAALCLVLAACGKPSSECPDILQPPAMYNHAPSGAMFVREQTLLAVDSACRALGLEPHRLACVRGIVIVLPVLSDQVSYRLQMCLLRHEWGHMNGWPPDHRGA